MYLDAIAGPHRDDAELVGLVEPNPGRLAVQLQRLAAAGLDTGPIVTGAPGRAGDGDQPRPGPTG